MLWGGNMTWHASNESRLITMTSSNHHRRFVTPPAVAVGPSSIKRKESSDGFDIHNPSTNKKLARPSILRPGPSTPKTSYSDPAFRSTNQLLAGYLAHEFLTKGTLFGEPWDSDRAEAAPVSADSAESRQKPPSSVSKAKADVKLKAEPITEKYKRYVEVTDLIKKSDGAHLQGIVNPTQLARFLHL